MAELEYAVAAETGAFMHCVGTLEIDGADLLHLSAELLERGGTEVSNKYPTNLSDKLRSLPRLVKTLGLEIEGELAVLNDEKTNEVLELRNALAHAKVIEISGTHQRFRLKYIKVSLPEKLNDGSGLQKVERHEKHLECEELRKRSATCMRMIEEVEQIREKVWRLFPGWPEYKYVRRASVITPDRIINTNVSSLPGHSTTKRG